MTPAARISAAIDLLDRVFQGELADRALAEWGRANRYAGSKDRSAIADLVYDVLRRKRSLSAIGGGEDGRSLLLGLLRDAGEDPDAYFGAGPYAPATLTEAERAGGFQPDEESGEQTDFPEWLWPMIRDSLGDDALAVAAAMRTRAPIHLRVNLVRQTREAAIADLAHEGIIARPHPLSPSALEIVEGARKVRNVRAFQQGDVELQDASSQAVADMVPLENGERMLDFCAGGGGKTLAVAGRVKGRFTAHDVAKARMKDLPVRAGRAGLDVVLMSLSDVQRSAPFDTVLVDAPCSGSGSWRRDPQGKWLITPEKLIATQVLQREILDSVAAFVGSQGHLVYATCSLLEDENALQVEGFLKVHPAFSLVEDRRFTPLDGGDGFYCAVLRRD